MIDLFVVFGSWYRSIMNPTSSQMNLGEVLVRRAVRCLDLTAAVPDEHEQALYDQADQLFAGAVLLGHEEARYPYGRPPELTQEPSYCEEDEFPFLDREALDMSRDWAYEWEERDMYAEREYWDSVHLLEALAGF